MSKQQVPVQRTAENPLIVPQNVRPSMEGWEVIGAFNAGVCEYEDEVILLLRVAERPVQVHPDQLVVPVLDVRAEFAEEPVMKTVTLNRHDPELDFSDPRVVKNRAGKTIYLTSISHLRIARSRDGVNFEIADRPSVMPQGRMECWGIEDPRITKLNDQYYITYSAISDKGVSVGLITTKDFQAFHRMGLILAPTNKDVVLFPERINGRYYMLHRPVPDGIGEPEIWLAESEDLQHWGNHRLIMELRPGAWDGARIGAGCVPIRTAEGWLILYHGADKQQRYSMGAALLDLKQPWKVLARAEEPFLTPVAPYEREGFFPDVVFACGAIVKNDDVTMYYGAADDAMASATFSLSDVLRGLRNL